MFFTFLFAWLFAAIIIYLWCYIVEVVLDLPVTGQTPCTAHASLKNIIRRVLRDASNMAILKDPQTEAEPPETTTNRTYEDLLATAILNKVIDNYQTDLRRSSSGSVSSKRSDASKKHKSKRYDEERWRTCENPDLETTSVSSVEDWCRSESSGGSKYVDHMSFTIQQRIEEISTSDEETTNVKSQYLHSCNLSRNSLRRSDKDKDKSLQYEDWQDNWLFSKKGKGSPKPVPVPMLVPNPSTDFRALIGDRDAEDTTDLSETGSDLDEGDTVHDIKTILVDSRTVIGGKNLLENINPEYAEEKLPKAEEDNNGPEECIKTNEVEKIEVVTGNGGVQGDNDTDDVSEARNNILIDEAPYVESDSLGSNTEKDMEYTEKYASFPRQISKHKSPVPSPRTSKNSITDEQREELINQNGVTSNKHDQEPEEMNVEDGKPPVIIRGSYSEKEKEKWRNPVALPNNPYSKENLDKRLQNTSSRDVNSSFGRDYYIREAKRAAGGRKPFLDDNSWTENSGFDSLDEESIQTEDRHEKSPGVDQNIFVAVPALIKSDEEIIPEENETEDQDELSGLESVPNSRPISLALSTDSEDADVRRVYNLETGKVFTYKNKDFAKNIIQDSKSPEGSKHLVESNVLIPSNLADEVDNKFDENHNTTVKPIPKEPIMNISKLNHIIISANNLKNNSPTQETINRKEFLQQQLTKDEPDMVLGKEVYESTTYPEPMRDVSKKYLESLVKNSKPVIKMEIVNDYSTPPISLQEFGTENMDNYADDDQNDSMNEVSDKLNSLESEEDVVDGSSVTPPISLEETGDLIEIETESFDDQLQKNYKSCIDLRFVGQNYPDYNSQFSSDEIKLNNQYVQDFIKSTPNLTEDKEYFSEDDDKYSTKGKSSDLEELTNIAMPSVSKLKKLFDQEKPTKATVQRAKSHLSTKPEIRSHQQQIHSLTARSLSKEFRRELQKTPDVHQDITTKNVSDAEEEKSETDETTEIPSCKLKIKFFENITK